MFNFGYNYGALEWCENRCLISCENKKILSRGKAENLLKEHFSKYVHVMEIEVGKIDGYVSKDKMDAGNPCTQLYEWRDYYTSLTNEGLLTVAALSEDPKKGWYSEELYGYDIVCEIKLTDKANPYIADIKEEEYGNYRGYNKEVKLVTGRRKIVKVIGITEPAEALGIKMSIVNYQYKFNPTAVGLALKNQMKEIKDINEDSARFILYDDGWRMEENK